MPDPHTDAEYDFSFNFLEFNEVPVSPTIPEVLSKLSSRENFRKDNEQQQQGSSIEPKLAKRKTCDGKLS